MNEFGIKETRVPFELEMIKKTWIQEPQRSFFEIVLKNSLEAAEDFNLHKIR